jgi:hypothetical protein
MFIAEQYSSRGIANSMAAMTGQQSLLGNTMIRSIEELVPNQITGATGFGAVGGEDQFYGWAPDV